MSANLINGNGSGAAKENQNLFSIEIWQAAASQWARQTLHGIKRTDQSLIDNDLIKKGPNEEKNNNKEQVESELCAAFIVCWPVAQTRWKRTNGRNGIRIENGTRKNETGIRSKVYVQNGGSMESHFQLDHYSLAVRSFR